MVESLKGWKTVTVGLLVFLSGILGAVPPGYQNDFITVVGIVVVALRALTDSPIFKKEPTP